MALFFALMLGSILLFGALGAYFIGCKRGSNNKQDLKINTAQDFLGIGNIRNGIVFFEDNNYCSILQVSSLNYYMLSKVEQPVIDDMFGAVLASINFPVQFYITTPLMNLTDAIEDLRLSKEQLPEQLHAYANEHIDWLERWQKMRSVNVRRNYVVVPCENTNASEARREIEHRRQILIESLSRLGLHCKVLNDEELARLFYGICNSKTKALFAPLTNISYVPLYIRGKFHDRFIKNHE